jgi:hypothetical protein
MSHMPQTSHNGSTKPANSHDETSSSIGGIPRAVAKQIIRDAAALKGNAAAMGLPNMTYEQYRDGIAAKEHTVLMRKREIAADRKLAALNRERATHPLMNSRDHLRDQLDRVIAPQGDGWAQVSREHMISEVLAEADQRSPIEQMLVSHILACSSGAMSMYEMAALADCGLTKSNYLGLGAKLSRTMAQLIDTIDRHRSAKAEDRRGASRLSK